MIIFIMQNISINKNEIIQYIKISKNNNNNNNKNNKNKNKNSKNPYFDIED